MGLGDKCKAKELAEKNAKAAEENSKLGLVALEGSEKQIAWAESIRAEHIEKIKEGLVQYCERHNPQEPNQTYHPAKSLSAFEKQKELFHLALDYLAGVSSASWWIDHRHRSSISLFKEAAQAEYKKKEEKIADSTPEALAAKAEATVRPEIAVTETVAEITVETSAVTVSFPEKRDDFWQIIKKEKGFSWSKMEQVWRRNISERAGAAEDRAAEVGNALLNAGFIVRCFDNNIRKSMVDGSFKPECKRWIGVDSKGVFRIGWRYEDSHYDEAKRITGAKWNRSDREMEVRAEYIQELLDFAEIHSFSFTKSALEILQQAQQSKEQIPVVTPAKVKEKPSKKVSRPDLDKDAAGEIDEDLYDN